MDNSKYIDKKLHTLIPLSYAIIALLVLLGVTVARAADYSDEQIANAIYKAENSRTYPYGIKSIKTYGNVLYAHKICLNTIRNNRIRFLNQSKYSDFLEFLGSRYCPTTAHILNINWVKNVRYFLEKKG